MNSIGHNFRITIYGESHGSHIGIIIDGCPAGIPFTNEDIKNELSRRKPGADGTTTRIENDEFQIISGVFEGHSTGTAINIMIENTDKRSKDYSQFKYSPRPGHADYVASVKYKNFNDYRGGGIFSGRMTAALVAAGAIAKKIINPIEIKAEIDEIGGEKNYVELLARVISDNDSIGGIVKCTVNNLPVGLGEPFFNSVESAISRIIFSIPGIKGIEFGAGFDAAKMLGSEFNDEIITQSGKTKTNNSGGINGGLTNGNELFFRIAVRPPASIGIKQKTFDFSSNSITELSISGRHDACIALRIPVIVEACTSIAIADLIMNNN